MSERRILIGGIGNIFHGDDAFGVEVVRRLVNEKFPDTVRVVDFGIRGYDLAFALLEGYETAIMVDAVKRGAKAGTIYLIEIGPEHLNGTHGPVDAHSMNPLRVLELARQVGGPIGRVLLLGCEPESLAPKTKGGWDSARWCRRRSSRRQIAFGVLSSAFWRVSRPRANNLSSRERNL